MKVVKYSMLLVGSALLLAAGAFAANTTKKTLHLYDNVTVAGKQLAPGNYRVEWSGPGPEVKIDIMKGGDTIATVPARVVAQNTSNGQDGYALKPGKHGNQMLSQVFFSGEKYDLNIMNSNSTGSSTSSSSGLS
ncbi:MAG TPA: hypothetical protein VJN93_04095 [Candidatus Acidoferrum sp.]|nr:hypothetical protein [Candidatus Acidoferrum sp.]